ncbi:MAG: hypothetical protein LBV79_00825 [Candidatus Adiutrix sp.]|jgi:hypothetical protein|nr:hypothetical protein [Candidatus Adiutrix sp.]
MRFAFYLLYTKSGPPVSLFYFIYGKGLRPTGETVSVTPAPAVTPAKAGAHAFLFAPCCIPRQTLHRVIPAEAGIHFQESNYFAPRYLLHSYRPTAAQGGEKEEKEDGSGLVGKIIPHWKWIPAFAGMTGGGNVSPFSHVGVTTHFGGRGGRQAARRLPFGSVHE